MKAAIVIEHFNPGRGGAETYTAELVAWLRSAGHEVTLFTQDWTLEPTGVTMVSVPVKGISAARRYLSFSTEASELVRNGDFDVVHSMARILTQNVFHPHGGVMRASLERSLASSPTAIERGLRRAARWLNTKSDIMLELENIIYSEEPLPRLVAVSKMVADDMKRFYNVDPAKIDVIYNGVDLKRFTPENRGRFRDALREDLGVPADALLLLLVAHNYRLKGAEIFIRVLSALRQSGEREVRGVIVGAGGDGGVYARLAEKMGVADQAVFHDAAVDIERFYAASDVYLHPTFYDPMSLVALEAMASGLPVITTRFNGCSEIMTDGVEGFLADDPRDIATLVSRVKALMDGARRDEAGRAARELALKHPLERNFSEIVAVYEKALAEDSMARVEIRRGEE